MALKSNLKERAVQEWADMEVNHIITNPPLSLVRDALRKIANSWIIEVREAKNITQERLKEPTELYTIQIGRIEIAETNVSLSSIKLIADHLKISVPELLDFSNLASK